jgi:hypothetical protein
MTTVAHTKKSTRNALPILCAECRSYTQVGTSPARAHCSCLREDTMHDDSIPLIAKLLDGGTDLVKRREARQGLRSILEREEQRAREYAAEIAFRKALARAFKRGEGYRRDLDICDALLGNSWRYNVEQCAARWRVSVEYVKDLRARLLRALEGHPVAATSARTRRAA